MADTIDTAKRQIDTRFAYRLWMAIGSMRRTDGLSGFLHRPQMRRHMAMSSDKSTFWSRVGHWFRPSRGEEMLDSPDGVLGTSTLSDAIDPSGMGGGAGDSGGGSGGRLSRFRLGHRESAIERLEEGYNKVIQLIESMQRHMVIQEERSATIAEAITKMAESLARVPETSERSCNLLESLEVRAETQANSLRRLEESLTQLPDLADAQRETMTHVSHQLDGMRRTTESVTTTLDGFRGAVEKLGTATQESASALTQLHNDSALREQRVAELLSEQTKRFTIFSVVAVCVAVVASVISLVALVR